MGLTTHPEAVYVLFPFNLPDAVARYDLGGQAMLPGEDQLPGVCRDYFTAQNWVDFSSGKMGMTVAIPENPLFQLGGFHFGDYQSSFQLERPTLLSWVATNYWETNFRAHQPGLVHARYRLYPYGGAFDEAQAHRRGLEALYSTPLLHRLGEPGTATLPERGTLLHLPSPPIVVLHIKSEGDGVIIRLLNASDQFQSATIASGLLNIVRANWCSLLGEPQGDINVEGGALTVEIAPRRVATVHLHCAT
jgi:alpha-mannosidase